MKTIDVSVVIPCYRCSETIYRAVTSVAEQTQSPAEIILVEDHSCDGTLQVLYDIQRSFPPGWIKVIALPKNVGAGEARNCGWSAAAQTYIAFLDSDDSWHPQKLAIQYEWMKSHPEVALTGHSSEVVTLESPTGAIEFKLDAAHFYSIGPISLLISNVFPTRSVMLKSALPQRFQTGKRYGEDYLLWAEICLTGNSCFFSRLPLSRVYKASYGEAGLSASLWKMEKGELLAYRSLYRSGLISSVTAGALYIWSILKFCRRALQVAIRHSLHQRSSKNCHAPTP